MRDDGQSVNDTFFHLHILVDQGIRHDDRILDDGTLLDDDVSSDDTVGNSSFDHTAVADDTVADL